MDRQQIETVLNSQTVQITTQTGHSVLGRPVAYTDRPSFLIERPDGRRELVAVDEPEVRIVDLGLMFRPDYGACPGCGADENRWCGEGCTLIDRKDYR